MAIRLGHTLGINTGKKDRTSGAAKQEVLSRIWWAHVSLERFMAAMTGYPSVVVDNIELIPLPLALSSEDIDETTIKTRFTSQPAMTADPTAQRASTASAGILESSHSYLEPANSGSYLKKIVQLGKITHDAVSIYGTYTADQTWQAVEEVIVRLTEELEGWTASLPDGFNFLKFGTFVQRQYGRERNTLDLLYHGTIIIITRPCLCRLDRRTSNQPGGPNEFNQRSALTCVESAKAVARLLPDNSQLDLTKLYEIGPWWIIVQIVTQSLIVLVIDISYEAIRLPHDLRETILLLKKLVRWLRAMNENNRTAKHAYQLVIKLLRALIVTVKLVRKILGYI
jgi:hypothetical protein